VLPPQHIHLVLLVFRRSVLASVGMGWLVAVLLLVAASPAVAGEIGLSWEGHKRSYLLVAPPRADPGVVLPLVIALHGAGQDAGSFAEETSFAAAAAARHMVVAFPNGSGTEEGKLSWNAHFCCGIGAAEQIDDVGFIGALIDDIARHRAIDRMRVYATGMSNGGMLTYQLAAAHPQWFAAIAPVSAAIGGTSRNGERFVIAPPDRPVPVMIIHGMRDPYVLHDGGSSAMLSYPKRSNMAVADAVSLWSTADGCTTEPVSSEPLRDRLRRLDYGNCRDGSTVVLWEIEDGEHNWPQDVRFPASDGGTRSAAEEILAFFAQHSRE
jgi:polyhydroxybutyrate depolymerase